MTGAQVVNRPASSGSASPGFHQVFVAILDLGAASN